MLAQAANDDGHCYLPENDLVQRASELLLAPSELISIAMKQLREERDVFVEPPLPVQVIVDPRAEDDPESCG